MRGMILYSTHATRLRAAQRSPLLLALPAALFGLFSAPMALAQAVVFTDRAGFEAQPGIRPASYPSFDTLAVVAPTASEYGPLPDAGCDESIVATFGGNSVTITAPAATPAFGLARPICIFGAASFAALPQTNTDPDPASPTIVANGEDDYDLVFERPVSAVGFQVVSNATALDSLQLFDENGQSLGIVRDPALETAPNAFEFFGVSSVVPIGSVSLHTTDGAIQNEGLIEILVPVGQAPSKVSFPGDTGSLQGAVNLVADGGTIQIARGEFNESAVIAGKHVTILGSGRMKTTLVGDGNDADSTTPIEQLSAALTLLAGGGVEIYDLGFRDNDAAVRGDTSGSLRMGDVQVQSSGFAVAGSFGGVEVHDTKLAITIGGVLLSELGELGVHLNDTVITGAQQIGVLIFNVPSNPNSIGDSEILIDDCLLGGDAGTSFGGIVVVGGALPVVIQNCRIDGVGGQGVGLYQVDGALLSDVKIENVHEAEFILGGKILHLAFGVFARDSRDVDLEGVGIYDVERVGTLYEESTGTLRDVLSGIRVGVGLGVQGSTGNQVDWDHPSNTFHGLEVDLVIDGTLPVPPPPELPGQ